MSARYLLSLTAFGLVWGACRADRPPPPTAAPPPKPSKAASPPPSQTVPAEGPSKPGLQFIEIVTANANAQNRLPMVIAVHGLGDRPESFAGAFRGLDVPVRLILPRAPTRMAHGGGAWMTQRIRDNRPDQLAAEIRTTAEKVARLAIELSQTRPTVGRPIITGFSQGGIISFQVATHHPEAVSAAIPVGGWLPPSLWPKKRPKDPLPPIRALHGKADFIVPYPPTESAIKALQKIGWDATLTGFPGVEHRVPPAVQTAWFSLIRKLAPRPSATAPP